MPPGVYPRKPAQDRKVYLQKWREANRDKEKAARQRYHERHPERKAASKRKHYESHKADYAEQQRSWRGRNPDKVREIEMREREAKPGEAAERARRWREEHPQRDLELKHNWERANKAARRRHASTRRARIAGVFIEEVDPMLVFAMHGGRCGICGGFIAGVFEVDHVVPIALGGVHGYVNVQPAHQACNRSKGAKLLRQYQAA